MAQDQVRIDVVTPADAGELLTVRRAAQGVRLVRFTESQFYRRLRHKLGWGGLHAREG